MSRHAVPLTRRARLADAARSTWRKWIIAAVAAAVAAMVGPGMVANAATLIHTKDIAKGAVHNPQVADGTLKHDDLGPWLKAHTLSDVTTDDNGNLVLHALDGSTRTVKGSGLHADEPYGKNLPGQDSSDTTIPAGETQVIWTACAPGESAVGGGFRIGDLSQESFNTGKDIAYPNLQVIASEAAYYKSGEGLVNGGEAAPVNDNKSFRPNAWAVTVHNASDHDSVARAQVVCAKVG